jgi:hypothetical protein
MVNGQWNLFFQFIFGQDGQSVLAGILFAPLLWLVGLRGPDLWIALAVGLVVTCRFLIDWNRKYRELWLDREKKE